MLIQQRKNSTGVYFAFSYIDPKTGKRTRLKKGEYPHFKTRAAAEEWAKSQEAYAASLRDKIDRREAWRKQYYQFDELLERYKKWQKKRAPNSWRNNITELTRFVFPYFLEIKKASNVNTWHLLFAEFRDWLEEEAVTIREETPIAYSVKNAAIRTLNTFLVCLSEYNLIDPDSVRVCKCFPEAKLNFRTFEDVITPEELKMVVSHLNQNSPAVADFFYVLYHTGMRFNELFSLPMNAIYQGHLTGPIHEEMQTHKIPYYGYLVLESQCAHKSRQRLEDGSHERKPLKGRPRIAPQYSRTIPIADKETWNILARRFKTETARLQKRTYGNEKVNYLLFEDLAYNDAVKNLHTAYDELKYRTKSFHCCRHSYATYLVGKTRSYFLARAILGHRSDAFERYNHIWEQMAQQAKQATQDIDEVA